MTTMKIKIPQSKQLSPLAIDGIEHRSALDFKVTEKDLERAFDELGETEEIRLKSLHTLREKLKGDRDLRSRLDDDFLLRYLRFRKFDVDRACRTIRSVYMTRRKQADLFSLPPNLGSLLDNNVIRWLPYATEDGCLLVHLNFGRWDIDEMSIYDVFVAATALLDVLVVSPAAQVSGVVGVWDTRGFSYKHALDSIHPHKLQFLANVMQSLYPWRIKKTYLVNCNKFIHLGFKTISLFLTKKMRDRIFLLGSDLSELHQYVKPELLPKDLGGSLEESECSITDTVIGNLSYLKYERSFGYT